MFEDENISLTAHRGQGLSLCPAEAKAKWHWMLVATTSGESCRQESCHAGRRAVVQAGEPLISPTLGKALPVLAHTDGKQGVAMVAVAKETSRAGETSFGGMLRQRQGVRLRGQRDALEERLWLSILLLCFLRRLKDV